MIPLSKPAIAAVALFNFIYSWNDFYGPLVYLAGNPQSQTLSVALASFRTRAPRRLEPDDGRGAALHAAR